MSLASALASLLGPESVSTEADDLEAYGLDWTRFYQPAPAAVVFPRSTEEVVALVQHARQEKIGLVPSGGRTGLSGGACALHGEIVVSFERMNELLELNTDEPSATVQSGFITANLQQRASDSNLYYPVDFASSGSSHIGGNIATNAGGIRVIRYGMTRDWVSGLKVVTGTGEVLDLNRGLIKNNTGYDLRHLFIGSEGTLGFIVEATLRLTQPPEPTSVLLLATDAMANCLPLLQAFQQALTINAFEFFSDNALSHVLATSDLEAPFAARSPYYVLIEVAHTSADANTRIETAFSRCLDAGSCLDAILSSSEQQSRNLWQYRERISEAITPRTPYKNDISVRVTDTPALLQRVEAATSSLYPDLEIVWFGHIGDGNLHLNVLRPESQSVAAFKQDCDKLSETVLEIVQQMGGSVSAEHGVGLLKKPHLLYSRSAAELAALKGLKQVFDPDGIMNPGKVFDLS